MAARGEKEYFYKITNHHYFSPVICSLNRLIRYTRFSTRHRINSHNMIKTKKSPKSPHCCILFSFSLKAMLDFEILKFTHSMFICSTVCLLWTVHKFLHRRKRSYGEKHLVFNHCKPQYLQTSSYHIL